MAVTVKVAANFNVIQTGYCTFRNWYVKSRCLLYPVVKQI